MDSGCAMGMPALPIGLPPEDSARIPAVPVLDGQTGN